MTGKLCLYPDQSSLVNEGLSPGAEDLKWASTLLENFKNSGEKISNGSDLPQISRAKKLQHLAEMFGISTT